MGKMLVSAALAGMATAAGAAPTTVKVYTMPAALPYYISMSTPSWIVTNEKGKPARKAYMILRNAVAVSFITGGVSMKKDFGGSTGIVDLVIAPINTPDKPVSVQCDIAGTANIQFRTTHLVGGTWKTESTSVPVTNGSAELITKIGDEFYQVSLSSPEPGKNATDSWGFGGCLISRDKG